ncbi:hypothetical protein HanXRQr2_Chr17g0784681 [Helianthus annuus]|uniref:Uncharacterized protein n=1 Tax=Helianthus annuus TaxID=4232 RepID=A0A9K3GSN8_HELAN|nr:hypothetical protein HanXRQr2_Chr17g0784681 [Helianthus annuus]KAJ0431760.1 hypothetical protein HanIR_Chr17g0851851 [Helianthus annuus]KAJ0811620.1 hypothetical protein HanPSC8_Chr17g0752691 [Helianthus annuus]
MVPIKSNQLLNQYPPLDLAEIKSQPLKLPKITTVMEVYSFQHLPVFLPTSGYYYEKTVLAIQCSFFLIPTLPVISALAVLHPRLCSHLSTNCRHPL